MNDKQTPSDETTELPSRRWFQRPQTWAIGTALVFVVWYVTPSSYSAGGIRVSVYHSGSPDAVTFVVRDSNGRLLSGVTVKTESFSGPTPESFTDASGIATILPGESEVLAVYIQGHEFRFRPRYLENFSPDCTRGLTINVSIQNDDNTKRALR